MIIYHQSNLGALAGNHAWYWAGQFLLRPRIAIVTAAAPVLPVGVISLDLTTAMFEEETLDGLLVLLTISHPSLTVPIQVVNNQVDVHRHSIVDSVLDSTANANSAVFTGSPTFVAGINANASGRAVNFEPADHADFGLETEFDLGSFTFEFWIEPETIQGTIAAVYDDNAMIGRDVTATSGFRFGYDKDGRVSFFSSASGGTLDLTSAAGILTAGTSAHLAVAYDLTTTTGRLILNGATIATATGSIVIPVGQSLKLNGTWSGGTNADATYDEFRVWDNSRSDAATLRDLNRRLLGIESGLVGAWSWSDPIKFVGLPFQIQLPSDEAGSPPSARLEIDNISREIVAAIRTATGSAPAVKIEVVRLLDQDAIELTFPLLNLRNVRADVAKVSGDLFSEDLMTDPYPNDKFTPGFFPGLF